MSGRHDRRGGLAEYRGRYLATARASGWVWSVFGPYIRGGWVGDDWGTAKLTDNWSPHPLLRRPAAVGIDSKNRPSLRADTVGSVQMSFLALSGSCIAVNSARKIYGRLGVVYGLYPC